MHVEAGHSAVPEEGPKDLRCPLCLYHTKYKRNMIDHIVLHRGNLPKCGFLGTWAVGGISGTPLSRWPLCPGPWFLPFSPGRKSHWMTTVTAHD